MEQKVTFYIYSWFIDDSEEEITSIRIYGVNEKNENVCARVDDFTPYVYIELPSERIVWNSGKAQLVGNKIDELLGKQRPLKKVLMMKEKLYGAYLDKNGKAKLFPYLFCSFSSSKDIKVLGYKLRNNLHIVGLGAIKLKMHESNADPILQLTCCRHIPTAGWVEFYGKEQKEENSKLTLCDKEYKVKWKNISPITSDIIAKPKILGFDIEVNSTNPSAMPNAKKPGDKVFQISCVIARFGDPESKYEKYLLSLGQPDQEIVGEDVLIYTYETEADLLEGFTKFICEENPNLIVGYNILGFDIPYMIDRAKFNMCIGTFDQQGFHKFAHAKEKTIKWSSSAYKNQEFQFLDAEGRVFVDLLPLVRRDYKFDNYKLKTISDFFLGQTKDPLSVKGIFKCFRIGTKKNEQGEYSLKAQKALGIVGKYCLVDSLLTVLLMDKLQMWIGLTEMAKTCKTSIFSLYTQGQQIKVFSQLYQYCLDENIVVETDAYQVSENERFIGAKVFPPIKGRHGNVVPFDFASLYPSTIIAYNIDYHTWVPDDSDIPDSECHVMEWQDCVSCCHDPKVIRAVELTKYITSEQEIIKSMRDKRNKTLDKLTKKELMNDITLKLEELKPYVKERSDLNKSKSKFPMCCKRYYRFLKEPRGVLPTVIQNLLDARKHTRKVDMVDCYKKIDKLKADIDVDHSIEINDLKTLLNILDKRQLAYKISANSMYGAMGVRKGYLPFMPGAMVTCYMGRVNIEKVANEITTKYKGELIYGDTDSNYITFPHLKTSQETWDYAIEVAKNITKLFPKPISLEFENAIYSFFFILTKKRYMYRQCLRDGIIDDKIGKKGVLLSRRDSSQFVRDIYESIIGKIADNISHDDICYWLLTEINLMFSGCKTYKDFVVTKAVGNSNGLHPEAFVNEKNIKKAKIGDYTVPFLSKDKEEREEQLKKKNANNESEFYLLCLPAQVQLAERMRSRGQRVDAGSRLEYVVTNPELHLAKQYEKVESYEYFQKHSDVIKIDHFYYLKALTNPLDQMLDVAFPLYKDFVLNQYNFRWKIRHKLLTELKDLFKPKLVFD